MASHKVLREQLIEMGFEDKLITGALNLLKDKATLESVIESIENGSAEIESNKELVPKSSTENSEEANNQQSVEVSPEEFLARKKAMEEKIKQRRIEIEEKEKELERQRELQRRKEGKDMGKMREEIEKLQREKFVESLRREKEADKAARDAILRQIEQDKAERRAKNSGNTICPPIVTNATIAVAPSSSNFSKDGKTKLAIRLLDGSSLMQEFDSKEVLSAVRAFIVTQKNIDYNITLGMPPKPAFSEEDMGKSLYALGLVPNARLQVVKRSY